MSTAASDSPIWTPSPARAGNSRMAAFMAQAASETGHALDDYATLHRWSVEEPERFWPLVWRFCGIRASRPWDAVLEKADAMPGARWFPGARLNFAENLLRYAGSGRAPEAGAALFG